MEKGKSEKEKPLNSFYGKKTDFLFRDVGKYIINLKTNLIKQ